MKIKEIIYEMKHQPVMTWVSITGTALAIFLIMVVVMLAQVKVLPFSPESNRDRWLVNNAFSIGNKEWTGKSNGAMSYQTAKELYYNMEVPEEVTLFDNWDQFCTLSLPDHTRVNADKCETDDRFWNVMDFTFIDGSPYDRAEFESGQPVAVLCESIAKKLFGTTEASGRHFSLNHVDYTVKGVVKDVSPLATHAYAQVWIPFTSSTVVDFTWCNGIMGSLKAIILAKDKSDFPEVRREFLERHKAFFKNLVVNGFFYEQLHRPYTQEVSAYTTGAASAPDMESEYRERFITFAILLLVPAINLSSMTHSRLRRQRETIGIRRAFGATKRKVFNSLLAENMIITLVAGIIGLIATVIFFYLAQDTLFQASSYATGKANFHIGMAMSWSTFGWALLFCFLLNLLSAGLPAFQASRVN
ncbi:MAG: ABC transporter permease, partial [Muribaculaceae bacterium]|nr:ABC transporter permease [Muribaculaceae bacterium]